MSKRGLNKREAIRHLIHTAIRLIMTMENPFAIHLIVHSADKLLIDVAKQTNRPLAFDWETLVKPERRKHFFKKYRQTYNYLKHANIDFDDRLPRHEIMQLNILSLFLCITNFQSIYNRTTDHMVLFLGFIQALLPNVLKVPPNMIAEHVEAMEAVESMTPKQYFATITENDTRLFPKLSEERTADLQDIATFYSTSFKRIRLQNEP